MVVMKVERINKITGTIILVTILLHGCSSGGGSSSSSPQLSPAQPTPETSTTTVAPKQHITKSEYQGANPADITFDKLSKNIPFNAGKLNRDVKVGLEWAYYEAVDAYIKNAKKGSPYLDDLIRARLLSNTGKQGPLTKQIKVGKGEAFSDQEMLTAMRDVTRLCQEKKVGQTLGDPDFISNQTYLVKVADHGWRTHHTTIAQVRHLNNTLQNGGKPGEENVPMIADASNSQTIFTELEDDHWYLYGQAYTFKGQWEPEASLKQEYRGQGAEFGTFRSMGSGFLLGGMFGLQKVSMEAALGESGKMESDARIYRVGPFVSWSNDLWTIDSMLTYGWVSLDTSRRGILSHQWKGSPKGSEWAAHLQGSYKITLDNWTMGLSLMPEAYVGYRMGTIEEYREKNGEFSNTIDESKHKGLTTRLGTGIGYVFPDLGSPTDIMFKLGVQKTHGWQDKGKSSSNALPKTPDPESRDAVMYYSLALNHQFGVDLDKMIGFGYSGTSGKKSGSDALTFTYRQKF